MQDSQACYKNIYMCSETDLTQLQVTTREVPGSRTECPIRQVKQVQVTSERNSTSRQGLLMTMQKLESTSYFTQCLVCLQEHGLG